MSAKYDNPYVALKQIFHEPNRLAIVSALCGSIDGLTFNELKEECKLTDGNLSRHLKALEEAGAIKIEKTFVRAKPRTTVFLTDQGRESFIEYLQALEQVLRKAAESAIIAEKDPPRILSWVKPVRA
ncbi:MAG TPA: transcriptional regulator [Candidatus Limnocylindrales bacterium]|nr:transcriptional regulator [Candidatus Limnocylindrales bacterium]